MKRALLVIGLVSTSALAAPDVVPTQRNESSQSDFSREYATIIGTDTAESGSTAQVINATAHAAVIGDLLRFTTVGSNFLVESHVLSVTTNTITLTRAIPAAPTAGDGFSILRLLSPQVNTSGAIAITGSVSATNPSVGTNGAPGPASSTQVGAQDPTLNLQPLKVDGSGALLVSGGGGTDTNYGTPTSSTTRTAAMLGLGSTAVSNANPVPVSDAGGSLTVDATSWPLPTGASTSALQTTGNTSLSSIDGKTPALGQTTMAGSSPVVIASNQTAIPVSGTVAVTGPIGVTQSTSPWVVDGSGVTQPVSAASLPLPTGASTSALQTTGNTSLSSIDTKTLAAGQATMAASSPVVIASNQSTINVTQPSNGLTAAATPTTATLVGGSDGTSLRALNVDSNGTLVVSQNSQPLPTGAATSALQTTGNTSLSGINGKMVDDHGVTTTALRVVEADIASTSHVQFDYSTTNIPSTYTQILASTAANAHDLYVYSSCSEILDFATGPGGTETSRFFIPPGGWPTIIHLTIASGTRLALRSMGATCSTGSFIVNLMN